MDPGGASLYEILGVAPGATAAEIRAAYLQLASQYHPDRHEGNPLSDLAEDKLAAVNAAYEVLSDPTRRAAYDAELGASGRLHRPEAGAIVAGPVKAVLRVLAAFVAVLLAVRLVPMVWRLLRGLLAPLAGTPAVPLAAVASAVVVLWLILRWRTQRGKRAG